MASSKSYLDFILEQLSEVPDVTYRAMMGEYILYCGGKVIGGIYDDRFLIKPVPAALELIKNPTFELPYDGAKGMILVEKLEDKAFLAQLLSAVYDQVLEPKKRKKKLSK